MMNFVLKTRNCVSKTRHFVFKMMNSAVLPCLRTTLIQLLAEMDAGATFLSSPSHFSVSFWVHFVDVVHSQGTTGEPNAVAPGCSVL